MAKHKNLFKKMYERYIENKNLKIDKMIKKYNDECKKLKKQNEKIIKKITKLENWKFEHCSLPD